MKDTDEMRRQLFPSLPPCVIPNSNQPAISDNFVRSRLDQRVVDELLSSVDRDFFHEACVENKITGEYYVLDLAQFWVIFCKGEESNGQASRAGINNTTQIAEDRESYAV
jgi:hypothetical protein